MPPLNWKEIQPGTWAAIEADDGLEANKAAAQPLYEEEFPETHKGYESIYQS